MENSFTQLVQKAVDLRPAANGLAIIVANERNYPWQSKGGERAKDDLPGVRIDLEAMKATFEELRFATFPIVNATADQIQHIVLAATARTEYPRSYRRIAFIFAGHGDEGVIHTHTGPINLSKCVFEYFQPRTAPKLGDIPKLFFIDACRGRIMEAGVEVPVARGSKGKETRMMPPIGNYLLACSTLMGMRSFEHDGGGGGFWMQQVAKQLREDRVSIFDVLTKVNYEVIKKFTGPGCEQLQQPILESTLNTDVPIRLRCEADELSK